jgi:hypothetical protein
MMPFNNDADVPLTLCPVSNRYHVFIDGLSQTSKARPSDRKPGRRRRNQRRLLRNRPKSKSLSAVLAHQFKSDFPLRCLI